MTTSASKSRPSAGGDLRPTNPHNALFSFTFGQKQHVIGLFRASLPKEFVGRLDFSSLKRLPADFVDARLKWRYSDLLFSVKLKGEDDEVLVYVLVEHQSKPDGRMSSRVLRYMVRAWDDYLKAHRNAKKLPLIVPIVVYHGKAPWTAGRTFWEMLDAPESLLALVGDYVPKFRPRMIDLRHQDADKLVDDLLSYDRV